MLRKKTADLTGTPVFPHAKWCIRYMLCNNERVNAVFARGGSYDAPFPFDCSVSNEEKALSSDGEQGHLVGIVTVPVLGSIAGIERVDNACPWPIAACQVDNTVDDD